MERQNPSPIQPGNSTPFFFTDGGIPVFLLAMGTPAYLRQYAPDFVNWIELTPAPNEQQSNETSPVSASLDQTEKRSVTSRGDYSWPD